MTELPEPGKELDILVGKALGLTNPDPRWEYVNGCSTDFGKAFKVLEAWRRQYIDRCWTVYSPAEGAETYIVALWDGTGDAVETEAILFEEAVCAAIYAHEQMQEVAR